MDEARDGYENSHCRHGAPRRRGEVGCGLQNRRRYLGMGEHGVSKNRVSAEYLRKNEHKVPKKEQNREEGI